MALEIAIAIVGSLSIVISIIVLGLQIFQKPIKDKEKEVKYIIDKELNKKIKNSKKVIKNKGLEDFVNELMALNSFRKSIEFSIEKSSGVLFWLGLFFICLSILAGLFYSFSIIISVILFMLDIEIFYFMCKEFRYLQDVNEKMNLCLKGKSITEITKGKTITWKLK